MTALPILNAQPPEKPDYRPDTLDVHSVFPTIQGEGPLAGTPAVFVRLAGCNLKCDLCDTAYTEGRKFYGPKDLRREVVNKAGNGIKLVVITGGEPLRQDLSLFVEEILFEAGMKVQVETNGTLMPEGRTLWLGRVSVVCSPKTGEVNKSLRPHVDAYKYVLQAGNVDPGDGLPVTTLGQACKVWRPNLHAIDPSTIFVQPLDEKDDAKNAANARACIESCLKFGYRFSPQVHKAYNLE